MRIGMLGTGIVGRTLGTGFARLGHEVRMGSRHADNPTALEWASGAGGSASAATFADAARFGELLVNATSGGASLDVLAGCDPATLAGKILVDVANPLDFSGGFPPLLSIVNDDSLGERIQAAHPALRVVKTFNTLGAPVMIEPNLVGGPHDLFLCGDDAAAKAEVMSLQQALGWPAENLIDLGGIAMSRGTEMYLALWIRLYGVVGTPLFNIHVAR